MLLRTDANPYCLVRLSQMLWSKLRVHLDRHVSVDLRMRSRSCMMRMYTIWRSGLSQLIRHDWLFLLLMDCDTARSAVDDISVAHPNICSHEKVIDSLAFCP